MMLPATASAAGSAYGYPYAQLFEVLAGEDGERLAIDVVGDHHLLILLEGGASPHYLARHLLLRPFADVDVVKRRRVRGCARTHAVGGTGKPASREKTVSKGPCGLRPVTIS